MDSGGSSGSMQSSSGDDQDHPPFSISSNPNNNIPHYPSSLNLSSSSSSPHQQPPPTFFDLSPNTYLIHTLSSSASHSPISQPLRSYRDQLDGNFLGASANYSSQANQSLLASQGLGQQGGRLTVAAVNEPSSFQPQPAVEGDNARAVRSSKKRTRASRRAPTTVLTTDTTNFRAMVQEFTGIPASPFSGSSYSRRLDLLTNPSSSLRSIGNNHLETTMGGSFYPLRPIAQKSHMVDATASTTNINIPASTRTDYQFPHELGLAMQNQPILAFHPLSNISLAGFGSKPQGGLSNIVPSLEELGSMSHGGQGNHNLIISGISSDPHDNLNRRDDQLRPFESSCKANFSASSSSSSFNLELERPNKALDNNAPNIITRGEGNVDSWICPSE